MPLLRTILILAIVFGVFPGCAKKKVEQPISFLCPDTVDKGNAVNFYVSASDARDLWWDFGDGSTTTVNNWNNSVNTHIFDTAGTLRVTLIVNNDSLHKFSKNVVVKPICVFKYSGIPLPGDTIYFQMAHAQSPATICTWDFGDGSGATGFQPIHLYSASGTYNVTVQMNVSGISPVSNVIKIDDVPPYIHLFDKGSFVNARTVQIQYTGGILDTVITNVDSTIISGTISRSIQYGGPGAIVFARFSALTYDPVSSVGNIAYFTGQAGWLYYDRSKDSVGAFFFSSTGWMNDKGPLSAGSADANFEKIDTRTYISSP